MAIIGIDLGTTNSLVSVWQGEKCVLIPNSLGEYLTPSVVGIGADGEILVGKVARERLITHPESTVASFKRFMGTHKTWNMGGRSYTPSDLASLVLRRLREDAEFFLGEPVEEAVISVPAYFNDFQRNATKLSGELAGLRVERLVNEPSAAALAYRMEKSEEDRIYLIFDFGGGTLDISVVDAFDNVIEIAAVAGDNRLGGDDINQAIAEKFIALHFLDMAALRDEEKASLLRESERIKRVLSTAPSGEMEVLINGKLYQMELDQKGLLQIAAPVLESAGIPLRRAMEDSGYSWADIDEIIMVGGSGKMPVVQNYLQFLSGKKPRSEVDPDVAVAVGAGMYAGIKERTERVKDILLTDICPFTLGVEISQKDLAAPPVMSPVIERNSVLPISRVARYCTAYPGQTSCKVRILQGEHLLASRNLCLGELEVDVPANSQPDRREAIDVRYTYDINGILEIDVTVVSTGVTTGKVIVSQTVHMSEEEMRMRREELKKLKVHPREREINRLVLERCERIFEENTGEIRQYVSQFLEEFTAALNTQDERTASAARKRTEKLLDIIEETPRRSVKLKLDQYLYDEWRNKR